MSPAPENPGVAQQFTKPQIIAHVEKSLDYTLYDAKWIPRSARFVVLGSRPRGTGTMQIYELTSGAGEVTKLTDVRSALKSIFADRLPSKLSCHVISG